MWSHQHHKKTILWKLSLRPPRIGSISDVQVCAKTVSMKSYFLALPATFSSLCSIIIIPQATWTTASFSLTDFQCPSNQLTGADARESLVEIHAYSSTILNNTEFVSHCWNDWGQKARPNLGMFCEPPFEQWDNLSTTMPIYHYLSTTREK